MQRIPLMDAKPDMVLADDLFNDQQMLLLKKGTALNPKSIKMLKSWGVAIVAIEALAPSPSEPAVSDQTSHLSAIADRMAGKFNGLEGNDVMDAIRRVATEIMMRRCQHEDAADAD